MRKYLLTFIIAACVLAAGAAAYVRRRPPADPFRIAFERNTAPFVTGRDLTITVVLQNHSGGPTAGLIRAELDGRPLLAQGGAALVTSLVNNDSWSATFIAPTVHPAGAHVLTAHYLRNPGRMRPDPRRPGYRIDERIEAASATKNIAVADVPNASSIPAPTISFLTPPPGSGACPEEIPSPKERDVKDAFLRTHHETFDLVSCYMPRQGTEVWSIAKPNVHNPETDYPEILFHPGDVVQLIAGGCVQAGGVSAFSSRRYVNPNDDSNAGRNEDGLHYGSASIPGVFVSTPFRELVQAGPIPITSAQDTHLLLQYGDDNYSDNGYYSQNWGSYEQCHDLGDAFVIVVIERGCALSDGQARDCRLARAMDLVTLATDANGLPVNPQWGLQWVTGAPFGAPTETCSLPLKSCGMPNDDYSMSHR